MLMCIRNLIECNRNVSLLYDAACQNKLHRSLIFKKINRRLNYLKETKKYKFMIETSSVCNANCKFCAYKSSDRSKIIMSDDIFNLIIKRIKDENINPTVFDLFLLGEPLIDTNIFNRITVLKEHFPKTTVGITSNFSLATPVIIEQLLSCGLNTINISLNSTLPESYKKIMGLNYNTTIDNINNLIRTRNDNKSNLKIQLSMVLCEDNYKEALKFMKLWWFKVDSLRLQRMHEWCGNLRLGKHSKYIDKRYLYPCNDLFERIPILSNGDYAICCADSTGLINKNISDTPILEAFNSTAYEELRQIHLDDKIHDCIMCNKCMGVNSNGANWIFGHD